MINEIIIGTCGLCKGAVREALNNSESYPSPIPPKCCCCGATPKEPFGEIIEMDETTSDDYEEKTN